MAGSTHEKVFKVQSSKESRLLVGKSSATLQVLLDLDGVLVERASNFLVEDLVSVVDVIDVGIFDIGAAAAELLPVLDPVNQQRQSSGLRKRLGVIRHAPFPELGNHKRFPALVVLHGLPVIKVVGSGIERFASSILCGVVRLQINRNLVSSFGIRIVQSILVKHCQKHVSTD